MPPPPRKKASAGDGPSPASRKKAIVSLGKPGYTEYVESVKRGLHGLLKSEALTDLHFLCYDSDSSGLGSLTTIWAHQAIFRQHSKMIARICDIAVAKQPGQTVCISLPSVTPTIMRKVIDYIYKGQATVKNRKQKQDIQEAFNVLRIKIPLQEDLAETSDDDEPAPVKRKSGSSSQVSKAAPVQLNLMPGKRKGKVASMSSPASSRSASEERSSRKPLDESKLKEECRNRKVQLKLVRAEKESKREVREYLAKAKRATARKRDSSFSDSSSDADREKTKKGTGGKSKALLANPLFVGPKSKSNGKQPTPQKRRMTESDKRISTKDSKKMRQEESSSDVDSDALAKRKKEVAVSSKVSHPFDDSSEEDSDHSKARRRSASSTKAKPKKAPKSAQKKGQAKDAMFLTEEIKYCDDCGAIFITPDALNDHKRKTHSKDTSRLVDAEATTSDGSSDSTSGSSSSEKSTPAKKPASKIKAERRKSKRSTSPPSAADSDDEASARSLPAKRKPGPKSKKAAAATPAPNKLPSRKSTSAAGGESSAKAMVQCHLCPEKASHTQFKYHVINHFKAQLGAYLPAAKPFICPECRQVSRDKVTLIRHFGLTHKKILTYVTEDDLRGTRCDSVARPAKQSSDSEVEAKKTKSNQASDVDEGVVVGRSELNSTGTRTTLPVKFSDESDDDFVCKSTAQAIEKSFDDLFSDDAVAGKGKAATGLANGTVDKDAKTSNDVSGEEQAAKNPTETESN